MAVSRYTGYLEKSAPLRQDTDKGLPVPKQRSLRKLDHRGIQENDQLLKISA